VSTDDKGNSSIRCQYRAKIWDKDTVTNNQVFVFDAQDKFVSVKDAKPGDLIPGNPAEDYGQTVAGLPPVVVETQPVSGARDVEPGITEIRVRFSKEMSDGSWSWSTAWQDSTPESIGEPSYKPDHRTCMLQVKLEPGRTYAWWLNSDKFKNFTDLAGRPAVPYLLIFQTKQN
jgi:Bacterial Ig-like domain